MSTLQKYLLVASLTSVFLPVLVSADISIGGTTATNQAAQTPATPTGLAQPLGNGLSGTATAHSGFKYNIQVNSPGDIWADLYILGFSSLGAYDDCLTGAGCSSFSTFWYARQNITTRYTGDYTFDWDGSNGNLGSQSFNSNAYYIAFPSVTGWSFTDFTSALYGTPSSLLSGDCTNVNPWNMPGDCNTVKTLAFTLNGVSKAGWTPPTTYVNSDITSNTTFRSNYVYVLTGNITVSSGITLTIEPSSVVKFNNATTSKLIINGVLNAYGQDEHFSSTNHIFLTSLADDMIGGDTNNDGNLTKPSAGDWDGIAINPGGEANFSYSSIRFGGKGSTTPMVENNGGTLNISTSTIAYSANYGVMNSAGTSSIAATDIGFNGNGVYVNGGVTYIGTSSILHNNYLYGAYNATNDLARFSAVNNYWPARTAATTTGPFNPGQNPSGTGDQISDYIYFRPWIGDGETVSSSSMHFIESVNGCAPYNTDCASVVNRHLFIDGSTTAYTAELNNAIAEWQIPANSANVQISTTSTAADIIVDDVMRPDFAWKGQWFGPSQSPANHIQINASQVGSSTSLSIQNTLEHELGHALGIDHSYIGNVMYLNQSEQVVLGPQDIVDFNYIWNP